MAITRKDNETMIDSSISWLEYKLKYEYTITLISENRAKSKDTEFVCVWLFVGLVVF